MKMTNLALVAATMAIAAESASEVYSFRGYPTEPIRNLTLRNVRAAHVKRPSSAESVVGFSGAETAQ